MLTPKHGGEPEGSPPWGPSLKARPRGGLDIEAVPAAGPVGQILVGLDSVVAVALDDLSELTLRGGVDAIVLVVPPVADPGVGRLRNAVRRSGGAGVVVAVVVAINVYVAVLLRFQGHLVYDLRRGQRQRGRRWWSYDRHRHALLALLLFSVLLLALLGDLRRRRLGM